MAGTTGGSGVPATCNGSQFLVLTSVDNQQITFTQYGTNTTTTAAAGTVTYNPARAEDNQISGNKITLPGATGIICAACSRDTIENNTIYDPGTGGTYQHGIWLAALNTGAVGASFNRITGNKVSGPNYFDDALVIDAGSVVTSSTNFVDGNYFPSGTSGSIVDNGTGSATVYGTNYVNALDVLGTSHVQSGSTLTIDSGATLTCAGGSTCPSGSAPTVNQGLMATGNSSNLVGTSSMMIDANQMTGADKCAKILAAFNLLTNKSGVVNAAGFTGNQVCSTANAIAMIPSTANGTLVLGSQDVWYLPVASSAASDGSSPLQALIVVPPTVSIVGQGTSGAPGATGVTNIVACTGTNTPVAGCTAPTVHSFAIDHTTITYAGGRTYQKICFTAGCTSGGTNDIVPGEPIRIAASGTAALNGSWRVCQPTQANPNRADANCPAAPATWAFYIPVNSGIVSSAIGGTLTGYSSNPSCAIGAPSGGGVQATCFATETAGTLQSVTIVNRGTNYQSAPSCTLTGGGGAATCTVAVETACASSCGTVYGEQPIFETGPAATPSFSQQIGKLVINCSHVNSCVPLRSLTANEQSKFYDLFLTGSYDRGLDMHSFNDQDADAVDGVRVSPGSSATCTVGTEGAYIGEYGPHGMKDFTADMSQCGSFVNAGIRIDGDMFSYFLGGHSEKVQYGILAGDSAPTRGFTIVSWAGDPSAGQTTDGAYQNENVSAIKIRPEYYTTTPATTDYTLLGIERNNTSGSAYTISDDSPVNATLADGYHILDSVTSVYAVDRSNGPCVASITTSSGGMYTGCGLSTNQINFYGTTSGLAGIQAAAVAGTPSSWVMPTTDGSNGNVLTFGTPSAGRYNSHGQQQAPVGSPVKPLSVSRSQPLPQLHFQHHGSGNVIAARANHISYYTSSSNGSHERYESQTRRLLGRRLTYSARATSPLHSSLYRSSWAARTHGGAAVIWKHDSSQR